MFSTNKKVDFSVATGSDIFNIKIKYEDEEIELFTTKYENFDKKSYGTYITNAMQSGGCTDVQPINGVYQKRFMKNLFKAKSVNDLSDQITYLKSTNNKFVRIFVLDIKDSKCSYDNIEEIQAAEQEVQEFFSGKEPKEKSPRKDIHKMINSNDINFFFREGSLKNYLLTKVFSPDLSIHFQSTEEGRGTLCQLAEILFNAFKVGYRVDICAEQDHFLAPEDYLILFNTKKLLDVPKNKAIITPISLFTLYPGHYKELYSIKEKYCESLSNTFKVAHSFDDKTKTTAIELKISK